MLNFISNHKMVFIFLLFSLLMLPITYKENVADGIVGYENILFCICTVLGSMCIGALSDIALKKEKTKNEM